MPNRYRLPNRLATLLLIKETPRPARTAGKRRSASWADVPDKRPLLAMLFTGMLLLFANMSIEPIITVYVGQFEPASRVTFVAGLVMAATALGSILSASRLGGLADRIGHWTVISICLAMAGLLLIPQVFVTAGWQLVLLRFLMGLALGGLLPCVASVIRHNVPENAAGTMLGYSTSAQYAGQVAGPALGGFVGGHIGMQWVFWGTSLLLLAASGIDWAVARRLGKR